MDSARRDDSFRLRQLESKFERLLNELQALGVTPGRSTTKSQNTFEHIIQLVMQLRVHVLSGISVSQQLNTVVKQEKKEIFFEAFVKSLSDFDRTVVLSNYWGMAAEAKKKSETTPLEPVPEEKFQSFLTPNVISESELEKLKLALNKWIGSDPTALNPADPSLAFVGPKKKPSDKRKAEADLFSSEDEIIVSTPAKREQKKPERKKKKEKSNEKKKEVKKKESPKSKKNQTDNTSKKGETPLTPKKAKPKIQLNQGKAFLEGKEIPIETLLRIHRIPFTPAEVADERRETMLSQATVSGDPRLEDEKPEPGITGPADPIRAFISNKSVLNQMEED